MHFRRCSGRCCPGSVSAPATTPRASRPSSGAAAAVDAAVSPLDTKIAPVRAGRHCAPTSSALPANERRRSATWSSAARSMDGLFLEQVWAGNPVDAGAARRAIDSPEGQARAALLPDQQGPVVAHSITTRSFLRPTRRARRSRRRRTSIRPTRPRTKSTSGSRRSPATRTAATGFFTVIRRGADGKLMRCRTTSRIRTRWSRRRAPRGRGGGDDAADAQEVPRAARAGVSLERLLRQRHGVDGARRADRADHRPVRDLRRRVVRLQGRVRSVHHARDDAETKKLASFGGATAGPRERAADRSEVPQPEARRARADSRRQRGLRRPATATAACRRPRSTCRTTTASSRKRAPSA